MDNNKPQYEIKKLEAHSKLVQLGQTELWLYIALAFISGVTVGCLYSLTAEKSMFTETHLTTNEELQKTQVSVSDSEKGSVSTETFVDESLSIDHDDGTATPYAEYSSNDMTDTTDSELRSIFNLEEKKKDTKLFFSEKLGVGFTYRPQNSYPDTILRPIEVENEFVLKANDIEPRWPHVEVFTKTPDSSLESSIKEDFLVGFDVSCSVSTSTLSWQDENYVAAEIIYQNDDSLDPWWASDEEKCPFDYSETNAVQYFLYNKNVSDKFIFLRVGQSSIAGDGTSELNEDGWSPDWSHSVRIVK